MIPPLWQNNLDKLPQGHYCYGIYFNYATNYQADYDFAIASEVVLETDIPVIEIEDLSFYEIFRCNVDEIYQTWQLIWEKEQQGLLKRAYSVDFEKYYPDGLVEIYIAVEPHC
ncbi:effector binding domain-containing protein [uncultured Haemophilus sp.]|uniref:GyrI-like domain-containing protein n=1 Tax=uncultured Haemophilus sp. TaxID=237779 RepID=UPI0026011B4E|nr:effector binding domain-containing protein [uncultured Haemophilus sp.]